MWKKIFYWIGGILLLLLATSYFVFQTGLYSGKPSQKGKLALVNGNFITMAGEEPEIIRDKALLIEDEKITAFMPSDSIPEDAKTMDLNNGYAMPGLIDLHVHLGGLPMAENFGTVDMVLEYMRQYPKSREKYLEYGVTTIQSLADMHPQIIKLRNKIATGELAGPRLYAAGPILTSPGGHPAGSIYKGRERLINGATRQLADPERARNVVDSLANQQIDKIKVTYTSGPNDSLPKMKYDVLKAITEQAHQRNLRVVVHIDSVNDIEDALRAGVDGIEHIAYGMNSDNATTIANQLVKQDVYVVPTLSVFKKILSESEFQNSLTVFSKWVDAGVKVALGTDSGNIPAGESVYTELSLYTAAGMSNYEALRTGTIYAARHLRATDKLGTLEPRKAADIIVFKRNPLENLQKIGKPVQVFKNGVIYINNESSND